MEEEIKGEDGCRKSADEVWKYGDAVVVDVDDDLWVKSMETKLVSTHCPPPHPFHICRVPTGIRRVDNDAYGPLIVSIGPYHRGNPSVLEMEEVKWRNLKKVHCRAGNEFNKYLKVMKEIEPQARRCYSGNINMEANEFIEMMLLDGLFIVQLLLEQTDFLLFQRIGRKDEDREPIYTIRGTLCRVCHDMLLLENQLPFFVLECLWKLTGQTWRFALWKCASAFICDYGLQFQHERDFNLLRKLFDEEENKRKEKTNVHGVYHLLHLVYLLLKPTCLTEKSAVIKKKETLSSLCHWFPSPSGQKSQFMECTPKLKLPAVIKKMKICGLPFLSSCKSRNKPLEVIPSAAELDEAGVEFQYVEAAKSFLDITFEHGKMKMPRLSVQDPTKSLFRNFIAFEQCFPKQGSHFTSYCSFMDYLVNTPRDVEILKNAAIIENLLGSDEEVARLFNDLCKGIFVSGLRSSYLAESFQKVRKHTQKIWPRWRAKLCHDYFGSPWSIISFLAATFVIILTIVQTYYAVFT